MKGLERLSRRFADRVRAGVLPALLCAFAGTAFLTGSAPAAAEGGPDSSRDQSWNDFVTREPRDIRFVDALAAITDKASRDLLQKPVDREAFAREIRLLAWKTRGQIVSGGGRETAEALRWSVFTIGGIEPDKDFSARAEAETAVMSEVLEHRRGVCLSLSLLYLAVAEEAALPLHGVSAPLHFFVRYDDGHERLNIELLDRGGTARSDNFYRNKFYVRKGEPFYLKNLDPKAVLAVYLSQLAAIYNRAGRSADAVEMLEAAQKANPSDPEIRTNLGVALRSAGRLDDALDAWRTAIVLDPYDDVAHYNLALGLAEQAEWLTAIYHFDESMRLGHAYDLKLLRRLEPHRPDAIYARAPRAARQEAAR